MALIKVNAVRVYLESTLLLLFSITAQPTAMYLYNDVKVGCNVDNDGDSDDNHFLLAEDVAGYIAHCEIRSEGVDVSCNVDDDDNASNKHCLVDNEVAVDDAHCDIPSDDVDVGSYIQNSCGGDDSQCQVVDEVEVDNKIAPSAAMKLMLAAKSTRLVMETTRLSRRRRAWH